MTTHDGFTSLCSWLREIAHGQSLFSANPEAPETVIVHHYRQLATREREDIENAILALLQEAINDTSWTSQSIELLVRAADPVFLTSVRRGEAIVIFQHIAASTEDLSLRRAALQGLVITNARLSPNYWVEQYQSAGDALIGVILEGIATDNLATMLDFSTRIDWTAIAQDAFLTVLVAAISDHGPSHVAGLVRPYLFQWPARIVGELIDLFEGEGLRIGFLPAEDTDAWVHYLRAVRKGLVGELPYTPADLLHRASNGMAARQSLASAIASEYTFHRDDEDWAPIVELLGLCNSTAAAGTCVDILLDTLEQPSPARLAFRAVAISVLDSVAWSLSGRSEPAQTEASLLTRTRRTLLKLAQEEVGGSQALALIGRLFEESIITHALEQHLRAPWSEVGTAMSALMRYCDQSSARDSLAAVYHQNLSSDRALAMKIQEYDHSIYRHAGASAPEAIVSIQDELLAKDLGAWVRELTGNPLQ